MTMIAYAFLQQQRLKQAKRKKRIDRGPPQPTLPAVRRAVIKMLSRKRIYQRCPHCRMRLRDSIEIILPK
jgi:hypothetical protein